MTVRRTRASFKWFGGTCRRSTDVARFLRVILVPTVIAGLASGVSAQEDQPKAGTPTKKAEPAPEPKVEAPGAGAAGQGNEPQVAGKEAESIGRQQGVEPALKGYCPAAYSLYGKALKGKPAFQSTHAERLYYLSSAEAKKEFDAHPQKFLPQFDGLCTTALGGSYGNRLPSDPAVFDIRDGRLFLFSSERAKRAYAEGPLWFIARAEAIFEEPALDGYCVVAYQQRSRAMKGSEEFEHSYHGKVYRFTDPRAKAMFIGGPEKYLPKYDGYCAEGVSRGKRYPADPESFVIYTGRTFLFFDAKARIKFAVNPKAMAQKADASWAEMNKGK